MLHLICIIEVTAQVTEAMSLKFIMDQRGRLVHLPSRSYARSVFLS